jgi:hypothetical protein
MISASSAGSNSTASAQEMEEQMQIFVRGSDAGDRA